MSKIVSNKILDAILGRQKPIPTPEKSKTVSNEVLKPVLEAPKPLPTPEPSETVPMEVQEPVLETPKPLPAPEVSETVPVEVQEPVLETPEPLIIPEPLETVSSKVQEPVLETPKPLPTPEPSETVPVEVREPVLETPEPLLIPEQSETVSSEVQEPVLEAPKPLPTPEPSEPSETISKEILVDERFEYIQRHLLAGVFDHVAYRKVGNEWEIVFQFLLSPADEWNTVLAIDSSESMQSLFGKALTGDLPLAVQEQYYRENLVFEELHEGKLLRFYQPEAYDDAVAKGYLKWTDNEIDPKAREILGFLGKHIDARGSCSLTYWGGEKGLGWVDFGEINAEDSKFISIPVPDISSFETESKLLPILQYLVAKMSDVPKTLIVILTDGHFSDIEEVKTYCISLALLIKAGERNFMKFVLLGIGKDVNRKTLAEFEGIKTGPTTELWDHKVADEMRELSEIFAGSVSENEIVAPKALILDSKGNIVKEFPDGLPAMGSFRMPFSSTSFTFQISPSNRRIHQSL
ncbi:MAG: hypothetical protein WA705_01460 [Candidatus Ozemobacteraceae bacterium]